MYLEEEEYRKIFVKVPRLCVDLLIPHGEGYLVGKRAHAPFKGCFAFPGGRVRYGETLTDGIRRICGTELGVEPYIDSYQLVTYIEYHNEISNITTHSVSLLFRVECPIPTRIGKFFFEKFLSHTHLTPNDAIIPEVARILRTLK